jgi:2-iminobutanoate/2-iminopropanoate deaminase
MEEKAMTMKTYNPASVPTPAGAYSQGAEMPAGARVLYLAGQVGMDKDGHSPADIKGQAELVWKNISAVLAEAGMGIADIVKINHFLTRAESIPGYSEVRNRFLGDCRPASTMVVVSALVKPEWLVEVEVVAAKS